MRYGKLWASTAMAAAILCAIVWIDRPLSLQMEAWGLSYHPFWRLLERMPVMAVPTAFLLLVSGRVAQRQGFPSRGPERALAFALSVALAMWSKDLLKGVFGRTWTRTWTHGNPSLVRDGVYGFHWMHSGPWYASFPSGHATTMAAASVAIALLYPRAAWLCMTALVLTDVSLLVQNFHFLSDILAGTWLGALVAWEVVKPPATHG